MSRYHEKQTFFKKYKNWIIFFVALAIVAGVLILIISLGSHPHNSGLHIQS